MNDILVVDDEQDIRTLIAEILHDEGYRTRTAGDCETAMQMVAAAQPSLIILDIWLKGGRLDGIDILTEVKRDHPAVPVVIISGHGNIEIAVAAIKKGAYDFIEKPFNTDQLLVVVRRAMETSFLRHENRQLKQHNTGPIEIIGSSPALRSMLSKLDKVAKSNARVMLSGGAGVGKELAARYIHAHSKRADAPFISVTCAGVEVQQATQMFFGIPGSNPSGNNHSESILSAANGGVLYLDEVADIPLQTQARLLPLLRDQQPSPNIPRSDIRVISSTSRDLEAEIAAGRLRQEFFDRLNLVPIAVPSLAERRGDIPQLARHFIALMHRAQKLPLRDISEEAANRMQTMHWPGNVRQLRNLIERVLILGDESAPIEVAELSAEQSEDASKARMLLPAELTALPLRAAREAFEREYLLLHLHRFGGNISQTARFVKLERSALHRKMKSIGLEGGDVARSLAGWSGQNDPQPDPQNNA